MDDITNKYIILVFALAVALGVIGFGSAAYFSIRNSANDMASNMEKDALEEEESRYTQYEGVEISGAETVALLKRFENDRIRICVKRSPTAAWDSYFYQDWKCTIPVTGTGATIEKAKTYGSSCYIDPSKRFKVSLHYDASRTGRLQGLEIRPA